MYVVTSPNGVFVAVRATKEEANEAVLDDVVIDGPSTLFDPMIRFVSPEHLTIEQVAAVLRMKTEAAEYYDYKIEEL
jgi:hypothetical protein